MPSVANFPFLKQLRLRHVVILSADSVAQNVQTFFKDNGITVSHTGAPGGLRKKTWKATWKPMEDEVVKASLEILLRKDSHPLLLCDTSGVRYVGVVVGCLRRLQNWNLNSIINEYRGFAGPKTRYVHEQMIELFDTDLIVIPKENPLWYCAQIDMLRDDEAKYDDYVRSGRLSASGKIASCAFPDTLPTEGEGGFRGDCGALSELSLAGRPVENTSEAPADAGVFCPGIGSISREGCPTTEPCSSVEVPMNACADRGYQNRDGPTPNLQPAAGDSLSYRMYYYSTDGPLNSLTGGMEPRLRRLNL